MARYVSMIMLVDPKKYQKVVWALVSGCAAFALPKECRKVARLA